MKKEKGINPLTETKMENLVNACLAVLPMEKVFVNVGEKNIINDESDLLRVEHYKNYHIKKSQIKLYNGATTAIFELIKSLKNKRIYL